MTEQPGGGTPEPGGTPDERLPAVRPPSTPAPTDRFTAPPSAHRNDLTPERAARIVRQSANARWVGLIAVIIVSAVRDRLLLLRTGSAGRAVASAAVGRPRGAAGRLDRARLQHLPSQLRAVPRRERRGRQGPDPQRPGEAVRPSQPGLHQQHARGRRPVCVRESEQHHAGVVEHGSSARTAQLQTDRGRDRVHPCRAGPRVSGHGRGPVRTGRQSVDRRGGDVRGLGRSELDARPWVDAVPGLLARRSSPWPRPRPRHRHRQQAPNPRRPAVRPMRPQRPQCRRRRARPRCRRARRWPPDHPRHPDHPRPRARSLRPTGRFSPRVRSTPSSRSGR